MVSATIPFGTWRFDPNNSPNNTCTGGTLDGPALPLLGVVALSSGGAFSDLVADYHCNWQLNLDGSGVHTTLVPDQTCRVSDEYGTVYTWSAQRFDFSVAEPGARFATLNGILAVNFVNGRGDFVDCVVELNVSLALSET